MIWNIVDRRDQIYRWRNVIAIAEAVEHDNTCIDSDIAVASAVDMTIDHVRIDGVSVREAIRWANELRCPVTLYLYGGESDATSRHFEAVSKARFPQDQEDYRDELQE
jgi:hypothetical protein